MINNIKNFTEYGGEAGSLENIIYSWEKRISSYQNYFQQDSHFSVEEKIKPGHQKTIATTRNGDTGGGSFRQLEFD